MKPSPGFGWSAKSRRLRALVVAAVVAAGVLIVAAAGFHHTLTYYRTPTDVVTHPPSAGDSFRLGGMVVPGSIIRRGVSIRFLITDGAHDLRVVSSDTPPSTFRPGEDAVVQGSLSTNGIFHATQVMVRHSNEYRPASENG